MIGNSVNFGPTGTVQLVPPAPAAPGAPITPYLTDTSMPTPGLNQMELIGVILVAATAAIAARSFRRA
jgi:hypothetical protein